jgi:hypothetical protein
MTPKEKAKELLTKIAKEAFCIHNAQLRYNASVKICALIAVDEVIDACEYNEVESYNTDWWNKVKQEIEQL